MKKRLSIFGLILFIAGTLFMPTAHRLKLAFSQTESASHCGCDHHSPNEEDNTPAKKHDSSNCAVCQIAMMPVDIADVYVTLSSTLTVEFIESPAPLFSEYITPRLIPYSCGPPA